MAGDSVGDGMDALEVVTIGILRFSVDILFRKGRFFNEGDYHSIKFRFQERQEV